MTTNAFAILSVITIASIITKTMTDKKPDIDDLVKQEIRRKSREYYLKNRDAIKARQKEKRALKRALKEELDRSIHNVEIVDQVQHFISNIQSIQDNQEKQARVKERRREYYIRNREKILATNKERRQQMKIQNHTTI